MMYWNGHDVGGSLISLMIGLLIAVIVIAVIFRIIDRVGHRIVERQPTPDDVLAERYARGEITDEEYQHRRRVLHGDDHAVR
jgi:putative membrane protein